MPDRKKIIKGLESLRDICNARSNISDGDARIMWVGYGKNVSDALAMLKEQEQAMKEKDGTISNLIAQIKEISQYYERVVRCKDCKHSITEMDDGIYFCKIPEHGCVGHTGKWFCADGRKKADAQIPLKVKQENE